MNRSLIAYIVVVVGLLAGMWVYNADRNAKLEQAQLTICARLNIVRAQSNITDLATWRVLSLTVQRNPKAKRLVQYADDMTVIRLTDCQAAVKRPGKIPAALPQTIGDARTGKLLPTTQRIESASRSITRPGGVLQ